MIPDIYLDTNTIIISSLAIEFCYTKSMKIQNHSTKRDI